MSTLRIRREPTEDESLDGPAGGTRFLQHRKGHRVGSDDILLAALANAHQPHADTMLDLGSGKGSVALMYVHANPMTRVIGLEAHPESFELAVRNRALNAAESQFLPILCDIRKSNRVLGYRRFELITGAPPFIRKGHGTPPKNEQRRYGRIEERGGVEDYCLAIARHLEPTAGIGVLLMDAQNETRTHNAFNQAGLHIHRQIDVLPRPNRRPIYQIFVGSYIEAHPDTYTLTMRHIVGDAWSTAYLSLRQTIGLE